MKKDNEVKGIGKIKGSDNDKNIVEGKYMMEVQSIKEDQRYV